LAASKKEHKLPVYPPDHPVGMNVPNGGSSCAKCEYVDGQKCKQKLFIEWNGSNVIPGAVEAYCCDFFEAGKEKDVRDVTFEEAGI
jgi:hypothetical protein